VLLNKVIVFFCVFFIFLVYLGGAECRSFESCIQSRRVTESRQLVRFKFTVF